MAYNPYTGRWEMDGAQQVQMQPLPRPQPAQMQVQPPKLGVLTVASEASITNLQMQPNDNALALHHGADGRKQRKQSVERADADGNDDA